jgi:phytoene desaturase
VYNSEVTKLLYDDDHITGVESATGTYQADIVVSNIDGAWFYRNLMPPDKNKWYPPEKIESMRHTNSYFTINLGLKQPLSQLNHHTFFVARNWDQFFEQIVTPGTVPSLSYDTLCYYLLQKTTTQPWMAPEGKATAFILVPVCGYDPDMDWNAYESTFANFIYDTIEQRDGIPIRDLIEEEIIYSPARWGSEFNLWENVILSFSLDLFQANGFRMPNKSREFTNLYLSGSSTIPGPGIPPCITSGELVRERIVSDFPISST